RSEPGSTDAQHSPSSRQSGAAGCGAPPLHMRIETPMSRGFPILFITATRIGDAVLSSGLIKRLADEIPEARFTIVAGPLAAPLFAHVPGLDRLIVFEKSRTGGHWFELWRKVRRTRWGLVVDLRG